MARKITVIVSICHWIFSFEICTYTTNFSHFYLILQKQAHHNSLVSSKLTHPPGNPWAFEWGGFNLTWVGWDIWTGTVKQINMFYLFIWMCF